MDNNQEDIEPKLEPSTENNENELTHIKEEKMMPLKEPIDKGELCDESKDNPLLEEPPKINGTVPHHELSNRREDDLKHNAEQWEERAAKLKDDLIREKDLNIELQEKVRDEATKFAEQVTELNGRIILTEQSIGIMKDKYNKMRNHINEQYRKIAADREDVQREMNRLKGENDTLLGRFLAKSALLQSETIDLPQDVSELQFSCLKLREELITAINAKERIEETLNSEILFLKDEIRGELASKETFEETITQENDALRSQVETITVQLGQTRIRCTEQEAYITQLQDKLAMLSAQSQSQIDELEGRVNELTKHKVQCDEEISRLRMKAQILQQDLENSETVQKDFVKLSQSLQVQLEEIRQGDNSVRWEHEDDSVECHDCKKLFHSKKEKQRCQHCCKIFCSDCNCKSIQGGPRNRTFRVCRVCHTLINKETAPYFSSIAPSGSS